MATAMAYAGGCAHPAKPSVVRGGAACSQFDGGNERGVRDAGRFHDLSPHLGISRPLCWPHLGPTWGITRCAAGPTWGLQSDARGVNDLPPCPGYTVYITCDLETAHYV